MNHPIRNGQQDLEREFEEKLVYIEMLAEMVSTYRALRKFRQRYPEPTGMERFDREIRDLKRYLRDAI